MSKRNIRDVGGNAPWKWFPDDDDDVISHLRNKII